MELEDRGDVAILRLRGGKANAMTRAFLEQLIGLIDRAEATPARAFVITGYEKYFSAGLALPELIDLDRDRMRDFMKLFDRAMLRLFACERPVVTTINGHAIAGGCVLALMADVRIMAELPLKIGLNEAQLGIGLPSSVIEPLLLQIPALHLPKIALQGVLFSPQEAKLHGLVSEVVSAAELESHAYAAAEGFAKPARTGVSQIKRALRRTAIENINAKGDSELERWLDTWCSAEARSLIESTVSRMKA